MYQPAKAHPAPSQAFEVNLFSRTVDTFAWLCLLFLPKVPSSMPEEPWLHLWPVLTQAINSMFPNPWVDKAVLTTSDM